MSDRAHFNRTVWLTAVVMSITLAVAGAHHGSSVLLALVILLGSLVLVNVARDRAQRRAHGVSERRVSR
jgi:small basic protein